MNNDVEALNLIDKARNISNLFSNNFELPFLAHNSRSFECNERDAKPP